MARLLGKLVLAVAAVLAVEGRAAASPLAPASASAVTAALGAADATADEAALAYGVQPARPVPATTTGESAGSSRVLEVPEAPGSLQLVLSALISAGAWQLTRSAKHLHFTAPDWYHTGGARQVGHATPLELDQNWNASALPSFHDAATAALDLLIDLVEPGDLLPRIIERVTTAGPRAPPAC